MRVLITGAEGQLGRALVSTAPSEVKLCAVNRAQCDIAELSIVERVIGSFRPDIVFNTAAYTAVDEAERHRDLAFRVNARGAENVAKASRLVGAQLVHISTDYVFDGTRSTPYPPDAVPNPINVYGASKLEGEVLASGAGSSVAIIRVGWLYSATGKNFLANILTALRESRPLSIVSDQVGCPTSAHEFALALWKTPGRRMQGIYHWANLGLASWYDFAREIAQLAQQLGLLRGEPNIRPVPTAASIRAARRPLFSVLDPTKLAGVLELSPSMWQHALQNDITREVRRFGL